nr:peptidoglycan-associated lipoprotein Pal [Nitrospirota bacterium]
MNLRPYNRVSVLALGLCVLVTLGGCSKSVQVDTQDQAMVPGPKVAKQAEAPTVSAPKEEVRVTEQPVAEAPRATAPTPAPVERPAEKVVEQPAAAAPAAASKLAEVADVFFDYDKFSIRMDASPILDANARLLKDENGWKLVIAGHCDERGTSAYNLVLGERRAQAAKKYLADLGVPAAQMQTTSYGKEKPFCTEHNQDCWQKNRRAHFSAQ